MKSYFVSFIAGLLLLNVSSLAIAKETNKDQLITACVELVGIYKTRSEKFLKAGIATSPSEAMKAGYCRGVLEEHANHTRGCNSSNWLKMAKFIAGQAQFRENYRSANGLLEKACNG